MSELDDVRVLAEKLLDQPWVDPDDDLRTLARNFLRADERATRYYRLLRFYYSVDAINAALNSRAGKTMWKCPECGVSAEPCEHAKAETGSAG